MENAQAICLKRQSHPPLITETDITYIQVMKAIMGMEGATTPSTI